MDGYQRGGVPQHSDAVCRLCRYAGTGPGDRGGGAGLPAADGGDGGAEVGGKREGGAAEGRRGAGPVLGGHQQQLRADPGQFRQRGGKLHNGEAGAAQRVQGQGVRADVWDRVRAVREGPHAVAGSGDQSLSLHAQGLPHRKVSASLPDFPLFDRLQQGIDQQEGDQSAGLELVSEGGPGRRTGGAPGGWKVPQSGLQLRLPGRKGDSRPGVRKADAVDQAQGQAAASGDRRLQHRTREAVPLLGSAAEAPADGHRVAGDSEAKAEAGPAGKDTGKRADRATEGTGWLLFFFWKKKKGTGESAQRTDGGRAGAVRHGGVGTQFRGVESPPGDPLRSLRWPRPWSRAPGGRKRTIAAAAIELIFI